VAKTPRRPTGFGEGQAPFGPDVELTSIYAAYGYACAFTGADLRAESAADPLGTLLRLDLDGPIARDTVIPATLDAIYAFERGHIAIGGRGEFLVALDRIDPEFLERLNPTGRLTLPADFAFQPSSALLKAHRDEFAEGLIPRA
jgi:hypothetical protein